MQSSEISTLDLSRRRKMQKIWPAILFTIFSVTSLIAVPMPSFADNTISGTVFLPAGHVAPSGGLVINLGADERNGTVHISTGGSTFIEEGRTSADYSLTIPLDPDPGDEWIFYYFYNGNEPYVQQGYYSTMGTTWNLSRATLLAGGTDHNLINLMILTEGNTITGTVSLPVDYVAPPDGADIRLFAQNRRGFEYVMGFMVIDEGGKSADYSLTVPPDPDALWAISYKYRRVLTIETGYYNSTFTTLESAQATLLVGAEDHSGINMKLHTTVGLTRTSEASGKNPAEFLEGQLFLLLRK